MNINYHYWKHDSQIWKKQSQFFVILNTQCIDVSSSNYMYIIHNTTYFYFAFCTMYRYRRKTSKYITYLFEIFVLFLILAHLYITVISKTIHYYTPTLSRIHIKLKYSITKTIQYFVHCTIWTICKFSNKFNKNNKEQYNYLHQVLFVSVYFVLSVLLIMDRIIILTYIKAKTTNREEMYLKFFFQVFFFVAAFLIYSDYCNKAIP